MVIQEGVEEDGAKIVGYRDPCYNLGGSSHYKFKFSYCSCYCSFAGLFPILVRKIGNSYVFCGALWAAIRLCGRQLVIQKEKAVFFFSGQGSET